MACGRCTPICPDWQCAFTRQAANDDQPRVQSQVRMVSSQEAPRTYTPQSQVAPNSNYTQRASEKSYTQINDDQPVYKTASGGL